MFRRLVTQQHAQIQSTARMQWIQPLQSLQTRNSRLFNVTASRFSSSATPNSNSTFEPATETPKTNTVSSFVKRFRDGEFDPLGRMQETFKHLLLWLLVASLAFELRTLRQDADDFKRTALVKEKKLCDEIDELRRKHDPLFVEPKLEAGAGSSSDGKTLEAEVALLPKEVYVRDTRETGQAAEEIVLGGGSHTGTKINLF
ncbi:hypothetical protein HDU77_007617 [Chytriomyces hyalinus]|nr:hypothetical protein HDU77_007617 [Chytriomyces hyalinus]